MVNITYQLSHKSFSILLLYLAFQTLLQKVIRKILLNAYKSVSNQSRTNHIIDKLHRFIIRSFIEIREHSAYTHPKQETLAKIFNIKMLIFERMKTKPSMIENVKAPENWSNYHKKKLKVKEAVYRKEKRKNQLKENFC